MKGEDKVKKLVDSKLDMLNELANGLKELGQESVFINVAHGRWLFTTRWNWELGRDKENGSK